MSQRSIVLNQLEYSRIQAKIYIFRFQAIYWKKWTLRVLKELFMTKAKDKLKYLYVQNISYETRFLSGPPCCLGPPWWWMCVVHFRLEVRCCCGTGHRELVCGTGCITRDTRNMKGFKTNDEKRRTYEWSNTDWWYQVPVITAIPISSTCDHRIQIYINNSHFVIYYSHVNISSLNRCVIRVRLHFELIFYKEWSQGSSWFFRRNSNVNQTAIGLNLHCLKLLRVNYHEAVQSLSKTLQNRNGFADAWTWKARFHSNVWEPCCVP